MARRARATVMQPIGQAAEGDDPDAHQMAFAAAQLGDRTNPLQHRRKRMLRHHHSQFGGTPSTVAILVVETGYFLGLETGELELNAGTFSALSRLGPSGARLRSGRTRHAPSRFPL